DTHLLLINLTGVGITGKEAEEALCKIGIVANRDSIPFDPLSALKTSGIRFGTPAVTSRGFGKEEMKQIAQIVVRVITNPGNTDVENQARQEVSQMCARFPIPGIDD
ncbi:MAG: serine hydroxymethyltransferase, partial [Dehalococcoidales bacterium]|nr:serine hydroxymethyltransferase [Dehalococcoidales bacterium]